MFLTNVKQTATENLHHGPNSEHNQRSLAATGQPSDFSEIQELLGNTAVLRIILHSKRTRPLCVKITEHRGLA